MAKSNRRRKQDKAKATARRAEQVRLRARAELFRAQAEQIVRLADRATPPAEVAEIVAAQAGDSAIAGSLARLRMTEGVPLEDLEETSRLLLARHPDDPTGQVLAEEAPAARSRLGALTFAAAVAHARGDEAQEHRFTARALAAVGTADPEDVGEWLEIVRSLTADGHSAEALELLEPRLPDGLADDRIGDVYGAAIARAYQNADHDELERAALARFADRSGWDAMRAALDDYLARTDWGETVSRRVTDDLADAQSTDWAAGDRDAFLRLDTEIAVRAVPIDDDEAEDITTAIGRGEQEGPGDTALHAFATDPATPPQIAARAAAWDEHAHFGLWQVAHPVAAPGVRCLDLVSGTRRYLDLPAGTLAGMRPWGVWLGAAVPVDGIWRGTGTGIWLSPVEADAVVEFAEQALTMVYHAITRPQEREPMPPEPMMFGLARPYGLRWEAEDPPGGEYPGFTSKVTEGLATRVVAEVLGYRLTSPALHRAFAGPGVPVPRSGRATDGNAHGGAAATGWPKAWLDVRVPALRGRTPRQAADETAKALPLLETLLRQFEYEGQAPAEIAWIRQELEMPSLVGD